MDLFELTPIVPHSQDICIYLSVLMTAWNAKYK